VHSFELLISKLQSQYQRAILELLHHFRLISPPIRACSFLYAKVRVLQLFSWGYEAAQLSNENKTLNGGGRIKHPAQRTVDLRLFKGEFNKQHREKIGSI